MLQSTSLWADPLGLPLGLQLYSVREMLPKDYQGTLNQVAALGYREVEAAGFFGHTAQQVKAAMDTAKLHCVSAHYSMHDLQPRVDEIITFHKELGVEYIICASPSLKGPSKATPGSHPELDLEDWRWNAEQFNAIGKRVKAAGLRFGYHNHIAEFARKGDLVPYDELLRLTDPALVTFEMDCGWVTVGGGDPVEYLKRYPTRISMLHLKDFKPSGGAPGTRPQGTELGKGTTNFHAIFAAASRANLRHAFVEQEEFDMPPFDALRIDAEYLNNLKG